MTVRQRLKSGVEHSNSMKVALFQPNLSHYRIPVFDLLGMQPGIELRVYAGRMNKTIPGNKGGAGFEYLPTTIRQIRIKGHRLLFMQKQVDVINQKKADVVILPWDIHYLSLLPALALARRRGVRVLLWGQGYSKQNNVIANGVRELLGGWSDGVILYTRTIAQRLINENGFTPEKVFVAQNALDQTPIQAARRKVLADRLALNTFRENLGLNPERTILFVSRLKPENKIDMLFEGLQLLRREQPDARLVIVGDGPERHRLQTLANRMGQGDAIIFGGAIYEEEKLAPYMLSAAVFCFPKYIGLSLMHAFGYGLPVATSIEKYNFGPEIEALIDGVNGLLFRAGDVDDMVCKWKTLLGDARLQASLSAAARKQVLEKYTIDNMVQGFLDAIRGVNNYANSSTTKRYAA